MKNIVVTGTSRGIGLELVRCFAEAGHQVLALSRNPEPVQKLQLSNVHTFSCDITLSDNLDLVEDYIQENWQQVDVLINNAGAIVNKPFAGISMDDFEKVYRTNVFAVAGLTQKLLPYMLPESHVVTISSMGGIQGSVKFPGLSAYSSSKGAVITLTELLAEEYKDGGPSFNVLALGAVQTEMLQEAFPGYQAPTTPSEMARFIGDFALTGNKFFNGKILQVSNSTP